MLDEVIKWILSVLTSAAALTAIAYFLRSSLTKFIGKSIEHRFDKKFENFKAEIRDNEKEFEQIRAFMSSARRERDSALQAKRFEAAEVLMRLRHSLGQLSMFVEYIKILNLEEISKKSGDPKITELINTLIGDMDINEKVKNYSSLDKTLPDLYLSEQVNKTFEAYKSIIINATITMKILSLPGLKMIPDFFKQDQLREMIVELAPLTKKGFDEFGGIYAYHLSNYFYNEISIQLRNELLGISNITKDTEAAAQLASDSRQALIKVQESLQKSGLSDEFINPDPG
ncbi:hypothetical protein ROM86_11240 [Cronobacter malonaticus]|uniref:hypothetical protein n=1 Tax=Cronobacter malonaticus TaxID=413503 RepID=UPI002893E296|nr:hypothetical protein [Cronobacter malonaticus]MDT3601609.1 hypothetical protein [Cronobacter malonaticus]MDT3643616.1 hypothetical protein [Cronobacter malonaticus]